MQSKILISSSYASCVRAATQEECYMQAVQDGRDMAITQTFAMFGEVFGLCALNEDFRKFITKSALPKWKELDMRELYKHDQYDYEHMQSRVVLSVVLSPPPPPPAPPTHPSRTKGKAAQSKASQSKATIPKATPSSSKATTHASTSPGTSSVGSSTQTALPSFFLRSSSSEEES
ncbi:predicted protein [Lichtheimia corymbifera JMRC:FSU:9682]|uniref:Uncharacterized protein n=1 Tax=Lichtheimia corymbifera JMRC:FSU:9682 TaxID=1263082 RepID=A0A068RSI4_9FUNG|nr:predicted protein [Lichtheimia corymbifera JMRC:FSU:9682]